MRKRHNFFIQGDFAAKMGNLREFYDKWSNRESGYSKTEFRIDGIKIWFTGWGLLWETEDRVCTITFLQGDIQW